MAFFLKSRIVEKNEEILLRISCIQSYHQNLSSFIFLPPYSLGDGKMNVFSGVSQGHVTFTTDCDRRPTPSL